MHTHGCRGTASSSTMPAQMQTVPPPLRGMHCASCPPEDHSRTPTQQLLHVLKLLGRLRNERVVWTEATAISQAQAKPRK